MYEAQISRTNPGCVVFLLDRSDSMSRPWAGSPGLTLAEGAAQALNRVLYELCLKCVKEPAAPPRRYFDVGVFGYGKSAVADEERVESALGGELSGMPLVSLTELATRPLDVREVRHGVDAPSSRMPIWVEPIHGYRTPMCEAIATVGGHVRDWVSTHALSYPPVVINITDGIVTDSPFQNTTIDQWAERLRSLATSDGSVLFLNVFLSAEKQQPALFPDTDQHLPEPGPLLFSISSPLPSAMVKQAADEGYDVRPGAHGLAFNADLAGLVRFLKIGTQGAVEAIRA